MFFPHIQVQRLLGISVRARLGLIQLLLLAALSIISVVAWRAINTEREAEQGLVLISRAQRFHLNADMMHDALRADVNGALRNRAEDSIATGKTLASTRDNARFFKSNLEALHSLALPEDLRRDFGSTQAMSLEYIDLATQLVTAAIYNPSQVPILEASFETAFDELLQSNEQTTQLLASRVEAAERLSLQSAESAKQWIVFTSLLTAVAAWSFVALIAGSVRKSLQQVSEAARALAAGNLSARSVIASQDEVGELSGALNKMADDLQRMVDRLLAEADRDAFSTQLTQALEMAETETDAFGIVSRAMGQISNQLPMELLIADSRGTALQQVAENPVNGKPGCGVGSLASCVAVRRGSAIVFDDSDALNSCPRLRNRACGPMAAVCVPVSFMGRAFGVLHVGAPDRKPPSAQQIAQLTALGSQAGGRIGTLRAFARTQLHAYTDGLTGLSNRRALEQVIEGLTANATPYAFALADLDQFKKLNDAHGHDAGDAALRLFAETMQNVIREADHAARWGGEEFAILFPHATAEQAFEVVERIRGELQRNLNTSIVVPFTASFGICDSVTAPSFEDVLRLADEALYTSKDAGRDRAVIWTFPNAEPHATAV